MTYEQPKMEVHELETYQNIITTSEPGPEPGLGLGPGDWGCED